MEKLTIKESGRYANFLDKMITEVIYLANYGLNNKIKTVTETHKRSEAYKDGKDEEKVVEFDNKIDVEIETLNSLMENLIIEKISLANSIANAKKEIAIVVEGYTLNLDASIEYAKLLRVVAEEYYGAFAEQKESKRTTKSTDYAFNLEGNQVSYYYNVEIETKLNYDKEKFVKKVKENKELADKLSDKVEKAMSSDIVEFEPKYSYLDSLEDLINAN